MDYTQKYHEMQGELPPQEVKKHYIAFLRENPPMGGQLNTIDLSGCDLQGVSFFKTEIINCTFVGANLSGVECSGARIAESNFSEALLESVGLGSATVSETQFFNARFIHASLTNAQFVDCDFRCSDFYKARIADAKLHSCDFTQSKMEECNMSDTSVAHSLFNDVSLMGSIIRGIHDYTSAKWIGTDIRNINFAGAYHLRRHIQDENYIFEFKNRSSIHKVYYSIWAFTSDCGRSLMRWMILILIQIAFFTYIYTIVDVDYGKYESTISPLYYSIATMTTLGYGDVVPASGAAQMIASLQVVFGYIMLGGLLSILTNKLARRAD